MAPRFRFRSVDQVAGVFVLAATALVLALLLLAGRAQSWFEQVVTVTVRLPLEGSAGLRAGADVEVLGAVAGTVSAIDIDERGRMHARVDIGGDFGRFVGPDSRAVIKKTFGLAGDAYLEISRGDGSALLPETVIASSVDRAPTELLQELVDLISSESVPMVQELRTGIAEYTRLAAELRDPQGPLLTLLARLDRIAAGAERGQGVVGRLLSDSGWADDVGRSLDKVHASIHEIQRAFEGIGEGAGRVADSVDRGTTKIVEAATAIEGITHDLPGLLSETRDALAEVRAILADVQEVAARLPTVAAALDGEIQTLPGTVVEARHAVSEIERLVLALQRHWLIRPYVEGDPPTRRISPAALRGVDFDK